MTTALTCLAALLHGALAGEGRVWVVADAILPPRAGCSRRRCVLCGSARTRVPRTALSGWVSRWRRPTSGTAVRTADVSGFEIMQAVSGHAPHVQPADDRRIPGWRVPRQYLQVSPGRTAPYAYARDCRELIRCLPALLFDRDRPEDASDEPHSVTHAPEALRYAVMSRQPPAPAEREWDFPNFRFNRRREKGPGMWD